jgi:hypothetical protein
MPDPRVNGTLHSPIRIALVGHCGPDAYALRSAVSRFVPGAEVVFSYHDESLGKELRAADLLLINRTLDGDFSDAGGIELIQRLKGTITNGNAPTPRLMLISNYAEAQSEAEMAGALPGFGKAAMNAESSRIRLRAALGLGE